MGNRQEFDVNSINRRPFYKLSTLEIPEKVRFESWLLKLFNLFDSIIVQIRAGRETQVQPIRRGDSPPFLLGECFERIKYFCR